MRAPAMAYECKERYGEMRRLGPTSRHCGACALPVVDLSSLTEAAARAVVARGGCVAFRQDAAGNVVFTPRRALRVLQPLAIAASLAACAAPSSEPEATLPVASTSTPLVAPAPSADPVAEPAASCQPQVEAAPAPSGSTHRPKRPRGMGGRPPSKDPFEGHTMGILFDDL